jgi:hypothetical protein
MVYRTVADSNPRRRSMFADTKAYSGFAVPDLEEARKFYGETLGLRASVPIQNIAP